MSIYFCILGFFLLLIEIDFILNIYSLLTEGKMFSLVRDKYELNSISNEFKRL